MRLRPGKRGVNFHDQSSTLVRFAAEHIDVVCPRCQRHAVVTPRPAETRPIAAWPRRLACSGCGHRAVWPTVYHEGSVWGRPIDPFFRLPLWLTAKCCGHTLWALNREHLDLLECNVAARLRDRWLGSPDMTLREWLPARLRSAKHRPEVLKTIADLRASLGADCATEPD